MLFLQDWTNDDLKSPEKKLFKMTQIFGNKLH